MENTMEELPIILSEMLQFRVGTPSVDSTTILRSVSSEMDTELPENLTSDCTRCHKYMRCNPLSPLASTLWAIPVRTAQYGASDMYAGGIRPLT
ncbi:hypothetical protein T265_03766 [Opisthorchis viverrini]|uniref:Uncharacterized protein n=1 Tax=Opisthorchis viverrini TaxID=6198 RepID=A0A075AHC8_OPIVI|nr:hypothetical protein T265_03766 [Opisthorchis viverrini]KER29659.1 hypothetical protein T265_03766 [Opisthorchis viverrini]